MTTAELGHGLLTVVHVSTFGSMVSSLRWPVIGRRLLWIAGIGSGGAVLLLARALVTLDFSLVYVADAARRGASTPFRLAGLWAGMAGSLLLWLAVVALAIIWGVGLARRSSPQLAPMMQMISAGILLGLAVTVRWASDPFATLAVPAIDGGGIVPILEHPAMLIHPPLLYLGLALTTPLFALEIATLLHRPATSPAFPSSHLPPLRDCPSEASPSVEGAVASRPTLVVALTSWGILTVAMALGAAWADEELGWGGFWAWDPVENGVLLPWLALTAFLHARMRSTRTRLSAVLPIVTFLLASLGALLSRSGAVLSVHAFAEASRVGRFLAVLAVVSVVVSLIALVRGWPTPSRHDGPPLLRGNAIVLLTLIVVVLIGTVWPVVVEWTGGQKRSTARAFFDTAAVPAALALLVLMAIEGGRRWASRRAAVAVATVAALGAAITTWTLGGHTINSVLLIAAAFAAVATSVGAAATTRRGGFVAHIGLSLFVLGAAAGALGSDVANTVRAGDTIELGSTQLHVGEPLVIPAPNHQRIVVPIGVVRGIDQRVLRPELKIYEATGQSLAETARTGGPLDDVQVAVRSVNPDGFIMIEAHQRPLLWCVWLGATLMAFAALLALVSHHARRNVVKASP